MSRQVALGLLSLLSGILLAEPAAPVLKRSLLNPALRHYGVAEGLPASEVLAFAQHPDHSLWVGTSAGLVRFDGVEMRRWQYHPEDANGLPGLSVDALAVDRGGRVWLASRDAGVSCFDGVRFRHYGPHPRAEQHWSVADVWSLRALDDGSVLAGTYRAGLWRLTVARAPERLHWVESIDLAAEGLTTADVLEYRGVWWIATMGDGLLRADPSVLSVQRIGPPMLQRATISALGHDGTGAVWFAVLGHGVWRISEDHEPQPMLAWQAELGAISALLSDRRGSVWAGTSRGLVEWRSDGSVQAYPPRAGAVPGIPRSRILSGLVDHEGGLWWGSDADGMVYLAPSWRVAHWLDVGTDSDAQLRGIRGAMVEPTAAGRYWYATRDAGLQRFDLAGGAVQSFALVAGEAPSPRPEGIRALHQRSDGRLWVAHRRGLSVLDAQARVERFIPLDAQAPAPATLASLIWSHGEDTWVAVDDDALYRFDARGELRRRYRAEQGWGATQVEAVANAADGFWLASERGIYRFEQRDERLRPVAPLLGHRFDALHFDGQRLWVHRPGRLERFDPQRGHIELVLGPESGLPVMAAAGLVQDAAGRLWLAGGGGLVRIDPGDLSLRRYDQADGLPSPELGEKAPRLDARGWLWAQGERGPMAIVLAELDRQQAMPPRLIDAELRYRVGDRELIHRAGERTIQIPFVHQDLAVSGRVMSFVAPERNRYLYRYTVDAQDEQLLVHQASYVFGRLPSGRQQIELTGQAATGEWVEQGVRFELEVAVPPWRALPALIGYLLGAGGALVLAASVQRRRWQAQHRLAWMQRDAQHQRELIRAKTESVGFLSHDLRNLLGAQLQLIDLLRRGTAIDVPRTLTTLDTGMRRMQQLLRDVVDQARLEAGILEIDEASFELPRWLDETLAVHRETALARGLRLDCMGALPTTRWHGDATRLGQLLDNLVGNAIKFARDGPVCLELHYQEPDLRFAVLDDGPGIGEGERPTTTTARFASAPAVAAGSGLGLGFCRALVQRMGGRLSLSPRTGGGTRAELLVPVRPEPEREVRLLVLGTAPGYADHRHPERQAALELLDALRRLEQWRPDRIVLVAGGELGAPQELERILRARGFLGPIDVQPADRKLAGDGSS